MMSLRLLLEQRRQRVEIDVGALPRKFDLVEFRGELEERA